MNRLSRVLAGLAVAGATTVLAMAPAIGAGSFALQGNATLNSDGTVDVPVTYSCPSGYGAVINLPLQQTVKGATTQGFGYGYPTCDGVGHTVLVSVQVQSGPDFKAGKAFADANFSACQTSPPFDCTFQQPAQFIHIGK